MQRLAVFEITLRWTGKLASGVDLNQCCLRCAARCNFIEYQEVKDRHGGWDRVYKIQVLK